MLDDQARGFHGLMSFATDADAAIAAADRIAAGSAAPTEPRIPTSAAAPVHRDGGAFAAGFKKIGGWVIGIGLIFAVKACLFGAVHTINGGGTTSSYTQSPASLDAAAGSSDTMSTTVAPESESNASDADLAATPTGEGADAQPVADDDGSSLSKPIRGSDTLTMPELRYCLAEDVRLTAQKSTMDDIHITDVERFNRNVDGFNEAVDDYNGRCRNRMFVSSQKSLAQSQVDAKRPALETEGSSRVD